MTSLAFKYHPDRNPGSEEESRAKFQVIQAANEILSDPQQRLKYDRDRLRAGYGKDNRSPKATRDSITQPPRTYHQESTFNTGSQTNSSPARDPHEPDRARTSFHGKRGTHGEGSYAESWRKYGTKAGPASPPPGTMPTEQDASWRNPPNQPNEYSEESKKKPHGPASPNFPKPKKRKGLDPWAAGDDEPMALNTSAYTSSRNEQQQFNQKPGQWNIQDATKGGGRTDPRHPEPGYPPTAGTSSGPDSVSNSRTSTGPSRPKRPRSTSPKAGPSELDEKSAKVNVQQPSRPKAVPRSRLGPGQKFGDFCRNGNSNSESGERPFTPLPPPPNSRAPGPQRGSELHTSVASPTFSAAKWIERLRGI